MKKLEKYGLTAREMLAADLTAQGITGNEIAKRLDCSYQAVSAWRRKKEFRDAVTTFQTERFQASAIKLRQLSEKAVEVLEAELERGENRSAVALKILQMIGVEKMLQENVPAASTITGKSPDEGRVAGRGRAALIEMELQKLQAEKQRLQMIETTAVKVVDEEKGK